MAALLGENGRPTVIPLPDTTTEKPILEQAPTLCTVYALQLNLSTSSLYSRISGISPQKPFDAGHPYSTVNLEGRVLSFSVERWIYVAASSWMQMIIDAEDQILWHSEALWLAVPDTVHVLEDLLNCTKGEVHIIWMSGVPNIVDPSRHYTQGSLFDCPFEKDLLCWNDRHPTKQT